jgi:NNP family nitrate/nitrite transporter-like MFS transporter
MIKVMLCGGLAVGCAILVNSYAVTCMIGKGMDAGMASATATVMNICLLFGGMVAGFVVDKVGKYNIPYLLICAIGGIGYYLVYAFVPVGMPTMIGMAVCAFIVAGSIGVNMGRIALIPMTGEFGPEMGGAAGGMNQTAAGLFGWLFPVIIASIFQDNYVGMFTCGAVFLVILGVFGLTIPELGNKGKLAMAAAAKEPELAHAD